jgi:hypothetical protein
MTLQLEPTALVHTPALALQEHMALPVSVHQPHTARPPTTTRVVLTPHTRATSSTQELTETATTPQATHQDLELTAQPVPA